MAQAIRRIQRNLDNPSNRRKKAGKRGTGREQARTTATSASRRGERVVEEQKQQAGEEEKPPTNPTEENKEQERSGEIDKEEALRFSGSPGKTRGRTAEEADAGECAEGGDQKRKRLVKHWIAIRLMALLAPAYGQDILMAEADRYRLGLGEEVPRVSFRFQGKEDATLSLEMGGDWALLSGLNRSFQTSIVNGRMSQEQEYDYLLRPRKMGTLMLGAARIRSKGKRIESKPLQRRVGKLGCSAHRSRE